MRNVRPAVWLLVAFIGVQLIIILFAANGPFLDEAIYVTSGGRILEGFAFSREFGDWYYREWFLGSPFVWPVLVAPAYALGGLEGARILALVCSVVALWLLLRAAGSLVGRRSSLWAAFMLGFNGLFAAHAHLAVYDALALALASLALVAVVHHLDDGRRGWLLLASLAVAVATITKYGYALAIVPLVGIAVEGSRPREAVGRAAAVVLPAVAVFVTYSYLVMGGPYPSALSAYAAHERPLGRLDLLLHHLRWLALPAALAGYGALLMLRRGRRWLAVVLLGGLFLAPAYHIWSVQFVSAHKHVVIGLLFAAPLAGLALDDLWRRWHPAFRYVLPLVLLLEGSAQWYVQEHSWPDARRAAAYVVENFESGDTFVSEKAWIYRMYLYWGDKIEDPLSLGDGWYIDNYSPNLCRAVWLVGERGGRVPGGDRVVRSARRCGHELVFEDRSLTINPGRAGGLMSDEVAVEVYRRGADGPVNDGRTR